MKDALIKTRLIHLYRGRPVGHFVLCGATADMPRKRYDLAQISRESKSLILNLGTDSAKPFSSTSSPHEHIHCHIYASGKRNPTRIFIEPYRDAPVAVNGEPIKQSRQLNHKDKVEVGKLQFEFLDVQTRRQVRVHMHDGVQYTGILEYWDISSMIFFMTWITEKKEQFLTLDFRNVLYIEFFLDESDPEKHILPYSLRRSRKLIRKDITVFLINKKKLDGLVDHKYRYKPGTGVFLLPPEKSKIQYLYVPGSSIESVVIVDAEKRKT
jgi:sRNA-binding regulator protein Hfq